MKTYKFLVSLCGGWCNGFLEFEAENEDAAYEKAMDFVTDKLVDAFPTLDIHYNVECYNPDDECIVKCKDCGKEIPEEDAEHVTFEDETSDYICSDCLDNYCRCDCCERYFHNDSKTEVCGIRGMDGLICDECYENEFEWKYV